MDRNLVLANVDGVLSDTTHRLDVLYWREFAANLNTHSQFTTRTLGEVLRLRNDRLATKPMKRLTYYSFHVSYAGKLVLDQLVDTLNTPMGKFKLARAGDLVLSRINCSRGSIAVVEDWQDQYICTNEMHVLTVTDRNIDPNYLQIILRHPYYQDQIFSRCTGDSLERKRFLENELLAFEVPIPPLEFQKHLIRVVRNLESKTEEIQTMESRLRQQRNSYVLEKLGIDIFYEPGAEDFYLLRITDLDPASGLRLDFDHNKPSFERIKELYNGRYPLVRIASETQGEKILSAKITSGGTPPGGIYFSKGIPLLHAANIRENRVDESVLHFVSREFHDSLKRSRLHGNEVLVTIAGTIGRAGINTVFKNANVNQAIAVLRLNKRMLPLFLSSFLNSDGGRLQFAKYRHDFGTPNINQTELGNLVVPLPPEPVQRDIVTQVAALESKIAIVREKHRQCLAGRSQAVTRFLLGEKKYESVVKRLK